MKYFKHKKENPQQYTDKETAEYKTQEELEQEQEAQEGISNDVDYSTIDEKYVKEFKVQTVNKIINLMELDGLRNGVVVNEDGTINQFLTDIMQKRIKNSALVEQYMQAVSKSLLEGESAVRSFNNFFKPQFYVSTRIATAKDASEKGAFKEVVVQYEIIKGLAPLYFDEQLRRNGSYTAFYTNKQLAIEDGKIQTKNEDKHHRIENKGVDGENLPMIHLTPITDSNGKPQTIFDIVSSYIEKAGIYNKTLDAYTKNYKYHILPNEKLVGKSGESTKNLFKKVIVAVKNKSMGATNEVYFEVIDPDQENYANVLDNMEKMEGIINERMLLWDESLEDANQKSEHEINVLQRNQDNLIKTLTQYFNNEYEALWNGVINDTFGKGKYSAKFGLKATEIVNKKVLVDSMGVLKNDPEFKEDIKEIVGTILDKDTEGEQ